MAKTLEVKVPDIGNFKDVDVIDVLVKPGDQVTKEQGLVTLETDKAAMDIPAPQAGVVRQVKLKKGDKASEGTLVAILEVDESAATVPSLLLQNLRPLLPRLKPRRLGPHWLPPRFPNTRVSTTSNARWW